LNSHANWCNIEGHTLHAMFLRRDLRINIKEHTVATMNVIFARKDLQENLRLLTTKSNICCAALAAQRLFNRKI
jgi:hypothetical protein